MTTSEKIVFRSALVVIALGVVGLGMFIPRWLSDRQAEAKIAALRAAGQPASLEDLRAARAPTDRNAATLIVPVRADLKTLAEAIEANYQQERKRRDGSELGWSAPFDPELQEALSKSFAAHPNLIELLSRAADCDDFKMPLDPSLSVIQVIEVRTEDMGLELAMARVLRAWARLEAARDRPEEALHTCDVLFRLVKLFDREPFGTNRSVSIAIRENAIQTTNAILQSQPSNPAARDALRKDAQLDDLAKRLRDVIAGERAFDLSFLRELAVPDSPAANSDPELHKLAGAFRLNGEINSCLDVSAAFWDDAVELPDLTLVRGNAATKTAAPATKVLVPAYRALGRAEVRILTETRCLLALLAALSTPGLEEKSSPTIDDLGLPAPSTIDPYNGKKLTLRKVPGGWLIYSVGEDLKDDGGKIDDDFIDVGLAPPKAPPAE